MYQYGRYCGQRFYFCLGSLSPIDHLPIHEYRASNFPGTLLFWYPSSWFSDILFPFSPMLLCPFGFAHFDTSTKLSAGMLSASRAGVSWLTYQCKSVSIRVWKIFSLCAFRGWLFDFLSAKILTPSILCPSIFVLRPSSFVTCIEHPIIPWFPDNLMFYILISWWAVLLSFILLTLDSTFIIRNSLLPLCNQPQLRLDAYAETSIQSVGQVCG